MKTQYRQSLDLETEKTKNQNIISDLLNLTLKLTLSVQSKSQFEDSIKKLLIKNKELNLELESVKESLRIHLKDNKKFHEIINTQTVKIEMLEHTLKGNVIIIEQNRAEQYNNIEAFNNILDKEKKIAETWKT